MLETRHGPVLTGMVRYLDGDTDDDEVLSLAWTMLHDDDQSVNAALLLHTAENWQAFNNAGRSFAGPMQNIIYADRDGSIGVLSPGFVPVRRSGDGRLPVDGSSGEADWAGRIPFDDLPRVVDPPSGIIVAANNRPVGNDYPYFLSHRWEPEWRAQRIHDVLDTGTRLDPATFYRLQLDTWSGLASTLVPHALTSKPQTTAGRLLQIHLEDWDYSMDAGPYSAHDLSYLVSRPHPGDLCGRVGRTFRTGMEGPPHCSFLRLSAMTSTVGATIS